MNTIAERDHAINGLRKKLPHGTVIYTVLRHVSTSGLSRWIDLYYVSDNVPLRITWSAAQATNANYSRRHEALKADGCGQDMGHAVVYHLSHILHGDGFALKQQWL